MSWAGTLQGDRELLKMVATAQKANKDSIHSWTGEAVVTESTKYAQGGESGFKATVTFVSDEVLFGVRSEWPFHRR